MKAPTVTKRLIEKENSELGKVESSKLKSRPSDGNTDRNSATEVIVT